MNRLQQLNTDLRSLADPEKARLLSSYFKTGPGEYGEGDVFWGLMVPQTRKIAARYADLPMSDLGRLLHSQVHEKRLLALIILVRRFEKSEPAAKKNIFDFYLENRRHINNWDLVDSSAPRIVGGYLRENMTVTQRIRTLTKMAGSPHLWTRRISILATFEFIRCDSYRESLAIARLLLPDREDLIHKAVGWMLREVSKRDLAVAEQFIVKHGLRMPRTMLRYALERFPVRKRKRYLKTTRS